jgi:hypothetical protein
MQANLCGGLWTSSITFTGILSGLFGRVGNEAWVSA